MKLAKLNWWHPTIRPLKDNDDTWDSMIHPNDLDKLISSKLQSDIFIIKSRLAEYVEIEQLNFVIRVKNIGLTEINYEGFYLNDDVETINNEIRKNSYLKGRINNMIYHHEQKCLNYYLIDSKNNKIKKRYIAADFKKL